MKVITAFIMTILMLVESVPVFWVPSLEVDAAKELKSVSTRATGHLYGLAEEGVPSEAMTNSIDISSVSQKVIDGLQHPTGDVNHVAPQLENCDYTVVYLQDAYSTWYYNHAEIMEMRHNGTYDWRESLEESYFPIIKEKVEKLKNADNILILTHRNPDGDTLGSGFALLRALKNMGKRVRLINNDPIPEKYAYLYEGIEAEDFEEEFIVSVDVAENRLLGEDIKEKYGAETLSLSTLHDAKLYSKSELLGDSKSV